MAPPARPDSGGSDGLSDGLGRPDPPPAEEALPSECEPSDDTFTPPGSASEYCAPEAEEAPALAWEGGSSSLELGEDVELRGEEGLDGGKEDPAWWRAVLVGAGNDTLTVRYKTVAACDAKGKPLRDQDGVLVQEEEVVALTRVRPCAQYPASLSFYTVGDIVEVLATSDDSDGDGFDDYWTAQVTRVSDASLSAVYLAAFAEPVVTEVVVNEPRRVRPLLSWDAGDGTWTLQSQAEARASFSKEAAERKPKGRRRVANRRCEKPLTSHAKQQCEAGLAGVRLWPGCETADAGREPQTIHLVAAVDDCLRSKEGRSVNFVAGRDRLLSAGELAAGVSLVEPGKEQLALFSTTLPRSAYELIEPLVSGMIASYYSGELDSAQKGTRSSACQIDRVAFWSGPAGRANCDALEEALRIGVGGEGDGMLVADFDAAFGRERWLNIQKGNPPLLRTLATTFSAHGRGMFIGLPTRVSSGGALKAGHSKGFTRGEVSRDVSDPNEVRSFRFGNTLPLPPSCREETAALIAFAEAVWDEFVASHPEEAAAQHAKVRRKDAHLVLGRTGWNSYSINLDWRTAAHCDNMNAKKSWSALCVTETGKGCWRFYGGHYLLPQFRVALDARQGVVIFHRSSDKSCGVHANSEIALPCEDASVHRVALVFYHTKLGGGKKEKGGMMVAADEAAEEEEEEGTDVSGGEEEAESGDEEDR